MSAAVDLQRAFSQNRAEELGYDVWEHYVVPPFYKELDLTTARKPRLIIGGRGCGKTMLLRYLSHQTMFSQNRPTIPGHALSHIGLYWRADTQFASAMSQRGVPADTWDAAFGHMAALILGMEVLSSLNSIAASSCDAVSPDQLQRLDLHRLSAYHAQLPASFGDFLERLEEMLWEFEAWVNDARGRTQPDLLPGSKFLHSLIREVQRQLPSLKDANFFVYLDEFENLDVRQQQVVNTWLKHSQTPLIFNLAMKRNAFDTLSTTGPEALSDIHDFRSHDLEQDFIEEDFPIIAAEILLLRFALAGAPNLPIKPDVLRDPDKIDLRRTSEYKKAVISAAKARFPGMTNKELANAVFADAALAKQLRRRIERALSGRTGAMVEDFFKPRVPEASVITPVLLSRQSHTPAEVRLELDKLQAGESNRFNGPTNWIQNNFVGSLLQLYEPQSRACPFYAGFETFCDLSRGNIRHFLELCYQSLNLITTSTISDEDPVQPEEQAEAARQASSALLREVKSFGRKGNQLHTFILRLGTLFMLAHQRPSLSESEQSHFTILRGVADLTEEDHEFFKEAIKWSVLYEHKGTKKKSEQEPETVEFVLNPIYAPFFHISYRKKRRLEITSDDVICLIRGKYADVSDLLRRYSRKWDIANEELNPTLFPHIESATI
jgi:hypothetical protein